MSPPSSPSRVDAKAALGAMRSKTSRKQNRRETLKISAGALLAPALGPGLAAAQPAHNENRVVGNDWGATLAGYASGAFERHRSGGSLMSLIVVMASPGRSCKPVLGSVH